MTSADIRISACLIVRNEAAFLGDCLASIAGLVDEIVLVDTGSTDDSVALAHRFGARVLHMPWRDDFAAARNFGLAAAVGDWILYIDADERVTETSAVELRQGLDAPDVFAARVLFRPYLVGTFMREYRLFRNDPRLRFRGSMHETIRPDLDALCASAGARVIDSPGRMIHLGYEGDLSHKHKRNLPMLQRAIADNPDRLYYWYDLARTLAAMGRIDEAIEVADRGVAIAETQLEAGPIAVIVLLLLTCAQLRHDRGDDVFDLVERGLVICPEAFPLHLLKARMLIEQERYGEALVLLDMLVAVDAEGCVDPRFSFDRRIFGCFAHDFAGLALLRAGRRAEAAAAFARAAAAAPDEPSYRIKAAALGGGWPSAATAAAPDAAAGTP